MRNWRIFSFWMNLCIKEVEEKLINKEIHKSLADDLIKKLKEETFYGIDAHYGVACSAKMNMIIAGDGHNNIICSDSLKNKKIVPLDEGRAHLILTNPPFGTSEGESLNKSDLEQYEIHTTKGQSLFVQKMMLSVHKNSRIVTVIDEGVLNTSSHYDLRSLILKDCKVDFILSLPDETFKPNKINVKAGVMVLIKREQTDEDLKEEYPIAFIKIQSLGYDSSGQEIKGFDLNLLINEISSINSNELPDKYIVEGYNWYGFKVNSFDIIKERNRRLDIRYWHPETINKIVRLKEMKGHSYLKELNIIKTKRGTSPPSSEYVSEQEGYALVVKAGSNISKYGNLLTDGDFIEEAFFKEHYNDDIILQDGDILLASTGDGQCH
jgi:type I restriction enzyme M protein